ncbi:uncharacterized protein LOC142332965 [Lycorma delicatula]|uniref:uncharacterized protein LOC142332965 n=1 Tax=Lycorma delicatula TaxID=130591 RepID=UPI003F5178DA
MEDTNFDVCMFLKEYEKYPCLYDKNNAYFKCRITRSEAEEALLSLTDVNDINTLRKKIKSIHCAYSQEVKKIKIGSKDGKVYVSELPWFNVADNFLKCLNDLSSESSFEVLTGGSSDNERHKDVTDFEHFFNNDQFIRSKLTPHVSSNILNKTDDDDDTSTSVSLLKRTKFKKRCNKSSSENDILNILKTHLCTNQLNSNNEFIAFGNSIAIQLQKMPLELALQLQADIQSLISTKRLEHLRLNLNSNSN